MTACKGFSYKGTDKAAVPLTYTTSLNYLIGGCNIPPFLLSLHMGIKKVIVEALKGRTISITTPEDPGYTKEFTADYILANPNDIEDLAEELESKIKELIK